MPTRAGPGPRRTSGAARRSRSSRPARTKRVTSVGLEYCSSGYENDGPGVGARAVHPELVLVRGGDVGRRPDDRARARLGRRPHVGVLLVAAAAAGPRRTHCARQSAVAQAGDEVLAARANGPTLAPAGRSSRPSTSSRCRRRARGPPYATNACRRRRHRAAVPHDRRRPRVGRGRGRDQDAVRALPRAGPRVDDPPRELDVVGVDPDRPASSPSTVSASGARVRAATPLPAGEGVTPTPATTPSAIVPTSTAVSSAGTPLPTTPVAHRETECYARPTSRPGARQPPAP